MSSARRGLNFWLAAAVAGLVLAMSAASASAATTSYPAGGSDFSSNQQGWSASEEKCEGLIALQLLCSSEGVYDSAKGNPPGSISAQTNVTLNLLGLFASGATWTSPPFTVQGTVTGASFRLERQLDSGDLLNLAPTASYTASLVDKTTGTSTPLLKEEGIAPGPTFTANGGAAAVAGGHTYAISLATTTNSTLASVGLLGKTHLRFDNVALSVQTAGGGSGGNNPNDSGGGNKNSSNNSNSNSKTVNNKKQSSSLSNARLQTLFRRGASSAPATVKGNRLFVKVSCPRSIGRACHIVARGMLNRRTAATNKRTVKVGRGKGKQIVLRVKPRAKRQVAKRKRLLVRENVRAGKARATIFKSRKLIRRR